MTKRFTLAYEKGNWWAVRDGDITLWKEEVIHLLNELATKCSQLKKENEQLKESVWSWSKSYNRVYEDNERILNTIKHAYYNERTQLGKSVLKQLLEAIQ